MDLRLEVLICTFGRRLEGLKERRLPPLPGVRYLVSCQNPQGLDLAEAARSLEERADIRVLFTGSSGLSNNRNFAFGAATAPFVLMADDDTDFHARGLLALADAFEEHPEADIITVASGHLAAGRLPGHTFDLSHIPRGYYPVSCEIALRLESLRRLNLKMSPLAGIGAPYLPAGEENIFVSRALQRGARGFHLPVTVFDHPAPSSGERIEGTAGGLRSKGACLRIGRGWFGALLRLPVEAARTTAPFARALLWLAQGYVYSIRHDAEL